MNDLGWINLISKYKLKNEDTGESDSEDEANGDIEKIVLDKDFLEEVKKINESNILDDSDDPNDLDFNYSKRLMYEKSDPKLDLKDVMEVLRNYNLIRNILKMTTKECEESNWDEIKKIVIIYYQLIYIDF